MKKTLILIFAALSFLATAQSARVEGPIPTCDPCPWVR
jgi:hypothetical protein